MQVEQQDNSIQCNTCGSTIKSEYHLEKYNTVKIYQIFEEILTDNFKPMMTYGLCGCHAFIMINKNTKDLIFIHHPFFEMIKIIFNMYYNQSDNFVTILKTPGAWVKEEDDKHWKMKSENESIQRQFLERHNVTVNFVPYSLNQTSEDIFNSTFYCNYKNKKFEYKDSQGSINYVDL